MSSEETLQISPEEFAALEARVRAGDKASEFWAQWGPWVEQTIFAPLNDQALAALRKATSDDQRMQAQHMSLAVEKFRAIIAGLINQAKGARAEFDLYPQEGENHE
jgi:hypothetical protein